jgi:Secretion system C-terminal sorting domain/Fibronectin type III domain/Putative metal-binding motif
MTRFFLLSLLIGCLVSPLMAQVTYNAQTQIGTNDGYFRVGSNMGYHPGFTDENKSELLGGNGTTIPGAGVRALRPSLPEFFLETYGYNIRVSTFNYYANHDQTDNSVIMGYPIEWHRDMTEYCPGIQSELFKNMYLPIWDGGLNGTPYNDDNYYAAYLYKTVVLYGANVKYWEIWNEPGFDYTYSCGWQLPNAECNWWTQNPDPCDYKLRAPIFHYVRMMRISWDIIKTLQPDDFVVASGLGYESFLDAVLRNTDNPVDGSVSAAYPQKAGAYFDCIGFHSYPHFDGSLRIWNNAIGGFQYFRHSDRAAEGLALTQSNFQNVLNNYGYNGTTYPKKAWTVTEINIPRKPIDDFIGSAEAQRNYIIKAVVRAMQNNISQLDWYSSAEETTYAAATFSFNMMGLYQVLNSSLGLAGQTMNDEGKSSKTVSDLLKLTTYDAAKTAQMNLPSSVGGGAFKNAAGAYTYVLWAKTTIDMSEAASATYSFPASFNLGDLSKYTWDYGFTGVVGTSPSTGIALTGAPIFLKLASGCTNPLTYFADVDGDGFGNAMNTISSCVQPAGYTNTCSDCNDNAAGINTNGVEVSDGADNDCNGIVDDVCGNVTGMSFVKQSTTSVLLNWNDMNDATVYNLQYRVVGTTTWSGTLSVAASNYSLTGLAANTTYQVRFRTKCGTTFTAWGTTLYTFTTPAETGGDCTLKPVLGAAEPFSVSSVKLTWNANPSAIKYQSRFKLSGSATWSIPVTTTLPTRGLSGLIPGATYQYQVRALCPPGAVANWTLYSVIGSFTMPSLPAVCAGQPLVMAPESEPITVAETAVFDIMPNPTTGLFKVNFDEEQTESIRLTDISGRVYHTWTHVAADQHFDISGAPDGLYIVTIINLDGTMLSSRLVKSSR